MDAQKNAVVVIGPAWHSCGSYEVFKWQIRAFRDLGRQTYFLAVSPSMRYSSCWSDFWRNYYDMTNDLGVDHRGHASRARYLPFDLGFWRELIPTYTRSYAYWRATVARLAKTPLNLQAFLQQHGTVDIVCNHYFNMPLATRIRQKYPGSHIVLETHDIQSRHYSDQKLIHPFRRKVDEHETLLADEIALAGDADILVHLNIAEGEFFSRRLPRTRHEILFPAAQRMHDRIKPNDSGMEAFDFLIVASSNYGNYKSVRWFLENVWSEELAARYTLKIVGKVDLEFTSRNDPIYDRFGSAFQGRVDKLDSYYAATGLVLIPMIEGHGISIKTIEAMAFGKPIVSTSLGFRGFSEILDMSAVNSPADTPQEFLSAMLRYARAGYPRSDARLIQLYENHFSPEAYRERYRAILNGLEK